VSIVPVGVRLRSPQWRAGKSVPSAKLRLSGPSGLLLVCDRAGMEAARSRFGKRRDHKILRPPYRE